MGVTGQITRGAQVPHFDVSSIDGRRIAYSTIWQRKDLLLVALSEEEVRTSQALLSALAEAVRNHAADAACVITTAEIPGVPRPGVLVADKWGEVHFVAAAETAAGLPAPEELVDWVQYVQTKCPECQGEAK